MLKLQVLLFILFIVLGVNLTRADEEVGVVSDIQVGGEEVEEGECTECANENVENNENNVDEEEDSNIGVVSSDGKTQMTVGGKNMKRANVKVNCEVEMKLYCSAVEVSQVNMPRAQWYRNQKPMIDCLWENEQYLGEVCLADLKSEKERMGRTRAQHPCYQEIEEHCDHVSRGSGRIPACLKELNERLLSEKCLKYMTPPDNIDDILREKEDRKAQLDKERKALLERKHVDVPPPEEEEEGEEGEEEKEEEEIKQQEADSLEDVEIDVVVDA